MAENVSRIDKDTGFVIDQDGRVISTSDVVTKDGEQLRQAKGNELNKKAEGLPYLLHQPEPLYTVRPRYAILPEGQRGQRSTLRIRPRSGVRKADSLRTNDPVLNRVRGELLGDKGGFTGFMLQGMQISFNEKSQVVHTMGDSEVVYYFGRMPTSASISGTLIDDADNQWFVKFVDAYNTYLRGTQLARNFELMELTMPNCSITGTIMSLSYSQDSQRDTDIRFNLNILVKRYNTISAEAASKTLLGDLKELTWVFPNTEYGSPRNMSDLGVTFKDLNRIPASNTLAPTRNLKESILGSIKSVNKLIASAATAAGDIFTEALSPLTDIIDAAGAASAGVTDLINAVENNMDMLAATVISPYEQLRAAENQFQRMVGSITSLPDSLSSTVSRVFNKKGERVPSFAGGSSMSKADAVEVLKQTNKRDPKRTPRVGPTSTASNTGTADDVASISF